MRVLQTDVCLRRAQRFAPDGLRCAAADVKGKALVWGVDV
jgi:hypothetical protein